MARKLQEKTRIVHQLIDQHGADLTWNPSEDGKPSAKALLEAEGFSETAKSKDKQITENDFNVKKSTYLKKSGLRSASERKSTGRRGRPKGSTNKAKSKKQAVTVAMPQTTDYEIVIATVNKAGGLKSYRASLAKQQQEVQRLEERLAEATSKVAEMEGNIASYEEIKKKVA